jgi:membrane protein DedA with SNARE-associated domain
MGFGLAIPLLVVAGTLHIPLKRYIVINSLGGLVLLPAMMLLGYYSGGAVAAVSGDWRMLAIVGAIILAFGLLHLMSRLLARISW